MGKRPYRCGQAERGIQLPAGLQKPIGLRRGKPGGENFRSHPFGRAHRVRNAGGIIIAGQQLALANKGQKALQRTGKPRRHAGHWGSFVLGQFGHAPGPMEIPLE
ncbi:hypothetical protein SDC9_203669 [bioreactor metagenome]|uniref:Uncharacterized protein n=1 Tax=bioreactor metagenome TaxID=1076179 RepID=A0A645IX35_9ZZZZ